MKSQVTKGFRKCFRELPEPIKQSAKKAYILWKQNPRHPSLKFKLIHRSQPIYSVRIGLSWRAVAVKQGETMIWFWIGSHADYNKLISQL